MQEKQISSPSNQTQREEESKHVDISSLKIQEDFNSSLVFGNDNSPVEADITEPDRIVFSDNDDIFATPLRKTNGKNKSLKYLQDTQLIEPDNQLESNEPTNTQLVLGETQVIDSPSSTGKNYRVLRSRLLPIEKNETNIISMNDTRVLSTPLECKNGVNHKHRLPDTQVIYNGNSRIKDNYDTQIIDNYNKTQTQVIDNYNTQKINQNQEFNSFESSQIQISPVDFASHRQVVNTQEQADVSIDSQGNNDTLEVQSDFEQESDVKQIEDSLITTKLKRRISQPGSPIKRIKRNQTTLEITSVKTPILMRMKSEPIVLGSPTIITSQSSPPVQLVKRTSSPSKEVEKSDLLENITIPDDDEDVEGTTIPDADTSIHHPPSSPEFSIPFDDGASESEDIEEVEEPITGKRRRHNIIESQPTIEETTIEENGDAKILRTEISNILTQDDIINHNSVWATYNNLKIYSGMVITKDVEYSNVDFLDGIYRIKNTDLKLLDIRIGDTLNVRNSPHKYVVTGLGSGESVSFIQCIRGYNIVYLCRYPSRSKYRELKVSLADCFMEVDDWAVHESNFRLIIESHDLLSDTAPLTPTKANKFTPFISEVSNKISPLKHSMRELTSLFSGWLFCITGIVGERKEEIKQMIESNGGILLDRELNEIFEYNSVDNSLVLKSNYLAGLSFGALISNTYCRSAKYLQSLALGWPILSDVYIDDCIRDKSMREAWSGYLLPSGQSKRLSVVKSQDVYKFRKNYEAGVLLSGQLSLNSELLHNMDIIVLTDNVNANSLETSKLIFYSFGAKSLQYCSKSGQVTKIIKSLGSDVLVYDDGDIIDKLLSAMASRSTRKRKESKKVRVVDWEWLVQCVIGGIIWESPTYIVNI
ncbi:DNA repair protein RAD9 [Spathaspora sp. JA1]|nr:DNA repair protein RAD9 [Spathaspora sp. JA1]